MTPALTVAIPFFNEEAHLGVAIRSILAQSFRDFELLLVDDGSTDGSLAVARSFAGDDRRVIVRSDGRRRHLAARLNEVVKGARGRFVARMDADDISHPLRFEKELALLEGVDAVGTWCCLFDEAAHIQCVTESGLPGTARSALEHGLLPHATMIARREWLAAYPYDEALTRAEDRDLWCRVQGTSKLAVVPEVLYAIRVDTSKTGFVANYRETHRQNRILFRRYGPEVIGWSRTLVACGASLAKSAVVSAAATLGASDALVRRRGRAPTPAELVRIREMLA